MTNLNFKNHIRILFFFILSIFYTQTSQAATEPQQTREPGFFKKLITIKDKDFKIFPIPIFDSRPDKKQTYGLMPIVLLSDKKTEAITHIFGAIGQYNTITKVGGSALFYYYPETENDPDALFEAQGEWDQKFYREFLVHYNNPHINNRYSFDARAWGLQTPFKRFFGYGPESKKSDESNYISKSYLLKISSGLLFPSLHSSLTLAETFNSTDIRSKAIANEADTLTTYGTKPGIRDSFDWLHRVAFTWDTREHGQFSKNGGFAEVAALGSFSALGSDKSFGGYSAETIWLKPFFNDRTITVLRGYYQDIYGDDAPFYWQSALGGENELRAFIPGRFVDNSKILLTWEQRILLLSKKIFGTQAEFYADPYFELGEVFDHWDSFSAKRLQPVGGIGIRAFVPPNVVGRLDVSFGKGEYGVYTMLGYPF